MPYSKWITVHSIKESDFGFIRQLAAKQPAFTVPPPYVLWLLKETNARSCMVAEHTKFGSVGYILSLIVSLPQGNVLHVWQLATSKNGIEVGATDVLLLALRRLMRRARIRKVYFTAEPRSAQLRAIRRYAYVLFGTKPHTQQSLPSSVSRNERRFVISVR